MSILMVLYFNDMVPEGVAQYWRKINAVSIDGKPTGITKG